MTKAAITAKQYSAGVQRNSPPAVQEAKRAGTSAEAAYYLAEHRDFQEGDPIQDWLQAEAEIDHRLLGTPIH